MTTEKPSNILKTIDRLAKSTEVSFSSGSQVHQAFMLGLWYKSFPDYMIYDLGKAYSWDLDNIDPANKSNWEYEKVYPNLLKFQFTADTGDSWHAVYRDLRRLGWSRDKVWREGGRLQYLLRNAAIGMPEGYTYVTLLLDISIATCKQVQVGTKMVEQPIFETKCEDLVDLTDDAAEAQEEQGIADDKRTPPFEDPILF